MRVLVIGGTRFSGLYVVQYLCDLGCKVAVFHRGQTLAHLPDGVQTILGDRHRLADDPHPLRRFAPHVVLDMIPVTEQDAQTLVRTFKGVARRVVAVSSQDVYSAYGKLIGIESGPIEPLPLTEDAPLRQTLYPYRAERPRTPDDPQQWMDMYDKILVERVVMGDSDLPGTVLRLPMVYGPRDPQHRLFEYLKRMEDGRPVILLEAGVAHWRWTRGYVENVAAAIALAVTDERASGRVYNVGEVEALSTTEWVTRIGQAAGWKGEIVTVPGQRLPEQLRPRINTRHHLVTDSTRVRNELGYVERVSHEQALRRTVQWQRVHRPENIDPDQFDYAAEDAVLSRLE